MATREQPSRDRVCAIVVTYYPPSEVVNKLDATLTQVDQVFVIDNTPGEAISGILRDVSLRPKVNVVRNHENVGIAEALNIGFESAARAGYEWAITLDQDSLVSPGMVEALHTKAVKISDTARVGIVCPYYRDELTGVLSTYDDYEVSNDIQDELGSDCRAIYDTITSGSLVRVRVVSELGGFRKGYFIDYVDIEFCLRLLKEGYYVIAVKGVVLEHNLGHVRVHHVLGRRFTTANHSARRRYYLFRNRIFVWKEYFGLYPKWVIRDAERYLKEILKIVVFERDRAKKLGYCMKGMLHGVLGIDGELKQKTGRVK